MKVIQHSCLKVGKRYLLTTACLLVATVYGASVPALAQKAASSVSVKIGYFNLGMVKASFPEGIESEQLKNQADGQLRHAIEEGNKQVEKAKEDKKSAEEIQKLIDKIQTEVSAKQQALSELVQNSNASAAGKLFQVVNAVAKDHGLDLVVDGAGVYAGGQKLLDNGVDVTQDIVKKLTPNAGAPTKSSSK